MILRRKLRSASLRAWRRFKPSSQLALHCTCSHSSCPPRGWNDVEPSQSPDKGVSDVGSIRESAAPVHNRDLDVLRSWEFCWLCHWSTWLQDSMKMSVDQWNSNIFHTWHLVQSLASTAMKCDCSTMTTLGRVTFHAFPPPLCVRRCFVELLTGLLLIRFP